MHMQMHISLRGGFIVSGTASTMDDYRLIVARHHVHFDVAPEVTFVGDVPRKVGFQLRLWGAHQKGARALPGCPKCLPIVEDLRRLARGVLPPDDRPTRAILEPFEPALYDSHVVPGADEVALSIRLVHREGYQEAIDPCEERCLKEIRERMRELKIPER
jgi:hypothetical protein